MGSLYNQPSISSETEIAPAYFQPRPGLAWVALLGVDGSGKSTVLRRLTDRSCELPFKGVQVFHRRPRLVYQSSHVPGSPVDHYGKPNHGALKSAVKIAAMALDWNLGYWRNIRSQARDGYLVIADRHSLLDMLADPNRYRYGGPASWVRLALKLVPMPAMILLLDAPVEVLQDRKQELNPEQITHLRDLYLEIFRGWPNCFTVNVDRPVDEVVSEIVSRIDQRFNLNVTARFK